MFPRRDGSHRPPEERRRERRERRSPQARPAAGPPTRRRPRADGGDPALTEPDLEAVLDAVTQISPKRRDLFEDTGDLDIAFSHPSLPRFRVNGFRQRGATSFAFRVIPSEIPNFSTLGLPPGVTRLAEERRGLVLVTGATGSGKTTSLASMLDHINRTRRQHIVTIEDPIEILHPGSRLHRQPARGRSRHRELRAGAAARPAPGPGRDPDRRAARRRDGAHRAAGRRIRPPRLLHPPHDRRGRDDRPHDRVLPTRASSSRSARSSPARCAA